MEGRAEGRRKERNDGAGAGAEGEKIEARRATVPTAAGTASLCQLSSTLSAMSVTERGRFPISSLMV
eukprot:3528355-Rhodomonas_salina.3